MVKHPPERKLSQSRIPDLQMFCHPVAMGVYALEVCRWGYSPEAAKHISFLGSSNSAHAYGPPVGSQTDRPPAEGSPVLAAALQHRSMPLLQVAEQIRAAQQKAALSGQAPAAWAIGARCEALYAGDGQWYSATVKGVTGIGNFLISFDEYGTEEEVGLRVVLVLHSSTSQHCQDCKDFWTARTCGRPSWKPLACCCRQRIASCGVYLLGLFITSIIG